MEQEAFNFSVALDPKVSFNIKDVLLEGHKVLEDESSGLLFFMPQTAKMPSQKIEMALEMVWPHFPAEKMRAWFISEEHYADAAEFLQRSTNVFRLVPATCTLLIIALMGAVVLSLSLSLSNAREGDGSELKRWNTYGIPLALFVYLILLVSMILFLIGFGAMPASQDYYLYHSELSYSMTMYFMAIPGLILWALAGVRLVRYVSSAACCTVISACDQNCSLFCYSQVLQWKGGGGGKDDG